MTNPSPIKGILAARSKLCELLEQAAQDAQQSGKLPNVALPEVTLERPQNPEHGDYASSFPLKLARAASTNPLVIGKELVRLVGDCAGIADVSLAPPGFINFTLKKSWIASQVDAILEAGQSVGDSQMGGGSRIQFEFVSANPTGPLHVGNGRGAILGSALAAVFKAAGFEVEQEYYINDGGNQVETFFHSLWVRYQQAWKIDAAMPEEGYKGAYMASLAHEILGEAGDKFLKMPPDQAQKELGQIGLNKMLAQIKADLGLLKVNFDVWFSESSLYQSGLYQKVMDILRAGDYLTQREGATWFVSTALGDDKDNVVVRGDGSPTYFASDIAYHYDKFLQRKFDKVVNIWGSDHAGHVSRMKAAVSALGIDAKRLDILLYQLVKLRRGGEEVRLSKRSGDVISMREVVEEVGADACRFFFLERSADSQMDFDLELAKKQSLENPVYYVQYAHARISSILEKAKEKGLDHSQGDVSKLETAPELSLIRQMLRLEEVVEMIVETYEPHHLAYYARDLATVLHSFYTKCRVVSEDAALSQARLKLSIAARIVLAKSLYLMGVSAPEKM